MARSGNRHLDRWRDREDALAADHAAQDAYADSVARGELLPQPPWAGEGVDLIDDIPSAYELVGRLAAQAESALQRALHGADRTHQHRL